MHERSTLAFMVLVGSLAAAVVALFAVLLSGKVPSPDQMPDEAVFAKLKDVSEVKAFVDKYPDTRKTVDRSGLFAADYRVEKGDPSGGSELGSYRYFRLRVLIDSNANPQSMFVEGNAPRFEAAVKG